MHPELTFLNSGAAPALDDRLTPIYPTTEGLGQARLRSLLHRALALLESAGAEALGLTETSWPIFAICIPRPWGRI